MSLDPRRPDQGACSTGCSAGPDGPPPLAGQLGCPDVSTSDPALTGRARVRARLGEADALATVIDRLGSATPHRIRERRSEIGAELAGDVSELLATIDRVEVLVRDFQGARHAAQLDAHPAPSTEPTIGQPEGRAAAAWGQACAALVDALAEVADGRRCARCQRVIPDPDHAPDGPGALCRTCGDPTHDPDEDGEPLYVVVLSPAAIRARLTEACPKPGVSAAPCGCRPEGCVAALARGLSDQSLRRAARTVLARCSDAAEPGRRTRSSRTGWCYAAGTTPSVRPPRRWA